MRRLNQMSRQCRSVIQLGLEHEKYSVWTRPNCLTASNLRKRRSIILNDEYTCYAKTRETGLNFMT